MDNRKYMLWLPAVAAVFLILGLWLGRALDGRNPESQARQKLNQVFDVIESRYVDPVDFDSLIELTIPELLHNLDPHSSYIPADKRVAAGRDLEGSFYGIGIQFQMINDTLYVFEVINGGGADEAGMQPGDRIIEVDGENIAGVNADSEHLFSILRGEKDTHVKLGVKRHNTPGLVTFDIVRAEVPVSPIDASYMLNDSIGYIRLGKFSENTYGEFLTVLGQLRYDGARNFVIDLRGNGGGYMNPAVLVANEFLDRDKIIVMTKGRSASDHNILMTDGMGAFTNERIVVLIDEYTASSSEILTGALQDNDRGLVIGRRSFGKGLVQSPFELPDSSEFRLTVQRYYTPSGRCIQKTYKPGHTGEYETEIFDRYDRGEIFSADSLKVDSTLIFHTSTGRPVYGGGGIIPDIFVPSDTTGVTKYYIQVANAGLLRKFAYEYADLNRETLNESRDVDEMLTKLPADNVLLHSFINYANNKGGIAPRWYYINNSAKLIVNQIKALIARDIVGMDGYFQVVNTTDPVVNEAIHQIVTGGADYPLTDKTNETEK